MPPTDRIRVFRIVEIVGTRERVEAQVRNSLHGVIALGKKGRTDPSDPATVLHIAATTLGEFPEVVPDHEERMVHAEGVLEKIRVASGRPILTPLDLVHDLIAAVRSYDATWPRFEPRPVEPTTADRNEDGTIAEESRRRPNPEESSLPPVEPTPE